jgi:hypothetical protein
MRQLPVYIPQMHLEDLLLFAKVIDGLKYILAHLLTAFKPAANAQADSNIRATGNFKCTLVSVETAEDAPWNASKFRNRGSSGCIPILTFSDSATGATCFMKYS